MSILDTLRRPVAQPAEAPTFAAALEQTRRAFEALDFSEEDAEIERLTNQLGAAERSIAEIDARMAEIKVALEGPAGKSGRDLARSLMQGVGLTEAEFQARSDYLEQRATLNQARSELVRAVVRTRQDIRSAENEMRTRFQGLCKPLFESSAREVRGALEVLQRHYADMEALGRIGQGLTGQFEAIRDVLHDLAQARILTRDPLAVSPEVRDLVRALEGKSPTFSAHLDRAVRDEIAHP